LDIMFSSRKFEKMCNNLSKLVERRGQIQAKLIALRLKQLQAAPTLSDMRTLPQVRCHELVGNRKGQLSVDLDYPYRLILIPADEPVPKKPDGGLDWSRVTAIEILGVEDTHE